ncbi:hypothetical protein SH661x_002723 [Planctomicrobium sp. SH661]|uniref:hypothetical protein n=1 Tax=Planctomicrobium sp. SH661 TaxID=3448124 RepID=UPI003F5C8A06
MRPVTSETIGLLVAHLIPGVIAQWGLGNGVPGLQGWVGAAGGECRAVGGFLNLTVASVGAGVTVSTVRWLVCDPVHHWTGIRQPVG